MKWPFVSRKRFDNINRRCREAEDALWELETSVSMKLSQLREEERRKTLQIQKNYASWLERDPTPVKIKKIESGKAVAFPVIMMGPSLSIQERVITLDRVFCIKWSMGLHDSTEPEVVADTVAREVAAQARDLILSSWRDQSALLK